jgi:3'-phosphoadenosine 5'-phosphosulfate sulfotransferase (PAPS reductase)/FAD synthetase
MSKYQLDYLEQLESEAIHIFREVAGQFERPALLFSGGKDSITLVHLALKAFRPGKFPFPLVHIDTGHNFPEALEFRDQLAASIDEKLIVRKVADTIKTRSLTEPRGKFASRNALQTFTLLDTIEEFHFDACIGGARRDEEKARAKERIFSVRDEFGQWNPKLQRPNSGTPTTAGFIKERTYAYSLSATGPNSTSGIISAAKKSNCLPFTSRTNVKCSNTKDNWSPSLNSFNWKNPIKYPPGMCGTAP